MKLTIVLLLAIAALSLLALPFMAAENETTNGTTNATVVANTQNQTVVEEISAPAAPPTPALTSVTPTPETDDLNTNESVGGWKLGWKQIGIWFTFNQEKKVEKELDLARLRLIQAKIAAKNNNTEAMEKALDAHQRIIDRVKARVAALSERNLSAEKLTGLNRAIQVHEIQMEKIQNILSTANLTDAQRTKLEARLVHVGNVTAKLEKVQDKIQEKAAEIKAEAQAENKTVREVVKENEIKTVKKGEWRPVIPENPTPVAEVNMTLSNTETTNSTAQLNSTA